MPAPERDRDQPFTAPCPDGRRAPPILAAGATRLEFRWHGDRWGHRVTVAGRVVAESIEGSADGPRAEWPPSPALVELSELPLKAGFALLGVGLAGRSHFSASISPHPDMADTLLFELACRVKVHPVWLGSTYAGDGGEVQMAPDEATDSLPATISWTYTIGPAGICPVRGKAAR